MLHFDRSAEGIMTLAGLHHHFDSQRFRWLAQQLRELDSPNIANLCDRWADEHADMARRERDAAAPAVDLDVLTSLQGDAR